MEECLEEGEINTPAGSRSSTKVGNQWEDNKENTKNYSADALKRRKLFEVDTYHPEYQTRVEWMQIMKERERKERLERSKNCSEERFYKDDTPKSGCETISDEHSSTFSSVIATKELSATDETSQHRIVWPSWLDPEGRLSATISPLAEFQPFIQQKKLEMIKEREELDAQLGDALQHVDVSHLKTAKGVLSGDGWKRQKDGTRLPNIMWKFLNESPPQDPRGEDYLKNITRQVYLKTTMK